MVNDECEVRSCIVDVVCVKNCVHVQFISLSFIRSHGIYVFETMSIILTNSIIFGFN